MGCASSNPLIDSGKNFMKSTKESAGNLLEEGENVIEETASIAKGSLLTSVEHAKNTMTTGLESAEETINSAMGKLSHTIKESQLELNEDVARLMNTEEQLNKINNSTTPSETDTVLISETENIKNNIHSMENVAFNKVYNIGDEIESNFNNGATEVSELQIVDLDTLPHEDSNEIIENINAEEPTSSSTPLPAVEAKQEEPPTSWEARADAILELRMKSQSIEINVLEIEHEDDSFEYSQQKSRNVEVKVEVLEEISKTEEKQVEKFEPSNNRFNTVVVVTEH